MALDYEVPEDKRVLYWLGDKLIEYRHPVTIIVVLVTALFAYWGSQLRLVTASAIFSRRATSTLRSTTASLPRSGAPTTS